MQVSRQLQMFATPKEVGDMRSGEYHLRPMSEVEDAMATVYRPRPDVTGQRHPDMDSYVNSIAKDADQVGGIEVPIRVRHFTNGRTGSMDTEVLNGHHRALAAARTNRLLPVIHHSGDEGMYDVVEQGQRDEVDRDDRRAAELGKG